ncbi:MULTISPECIES: hypothetical protein [Providencia]|uniref:hypothetical protein n=1 Tax=Providencia rettgeri TaxID=587 RepID=UPI0019D062F6|nr:hypothetical protein [Providencia rettgeri]MBN6366261.1 hypothetical protein [Providencia rettgeri]
MQTRNNFRERAFKAFKNDFYTGDAIKQYAYFHSLFTAVCFTYFIGLFSAGPNEIVKSTCLMWATTFFATALLLNVCFSIYYIFKSKFSGDIYDRKNIFEMHAYTYSINFLIILSLSTPIVGMILLVFYYSLLVGLVVICIALISLFLALHIAPKEIRKFKLKYEIERSTLLKNNMFKDLYRLESIHRFPLRKIETERNVAIKFAYGIKLIDIVEGVLINDIKSKEQIGIIKSVKKELNEYLIAFSSLTKLDVAGVNEIKKLIFMLDDCCNNMEFDIRSLNKQVIKVTEYARELIDDNQY